MDAAYYRNTAQSSSLEIEQHAAQLIFGPQTMQMSDEIEKSQSAATKQTWSGQRRRIE